MGYVKRQIQKLSQEAKGKRLARKKAEEWFENSVKSMNEKAVIRTPQRFRSGKIYVFRYEHPKHEKTLPWWDMNPVVFALDPIDGNDLGINLNLLPTDIKEDMLDFIYDQLENRIKSETIGNKSNHATQQGSLTITYQGAKSFLDQYGLDFAIRQYIPSRKTQQSVVAYEEWPRIALCDFIELNGTTIGMIKSLFRKNLNKK